MVVNMKAPVQVLLVKAGYGTTHNVKCSQCIAYSILVNKLNVHNNTNVNTIYE